MIETISLDLINESRSIPVSMFIISKKLTRSSVGKLPEEPGANGHPPNPPTHASNLLIP